MATNTGHTQRVSQEEFPSLRGAGLEIKDVSKDLIFIAGSLMRCLADQLTYGDAHPSDLIFIDSAIFKELNEKKHGQNYHSTADTSCLFTIAKEQMKAFANIYRVHIKIHQSNGVSLKYSGTMAPVDGRVMNIVHHHGDVFSSTRYNPTSRLSLDEATAEIALKDSLRATDPAYKIGFKTLAMALFPEPSAEPITRGVEATIAEARTIVSSSTTSHQDSLGSANKHQSITKRKLSGSSQVEEGNGFPGSGKRIKTTSEIVEQDHHEQIVEKHGTQNQEGIMGEEISIVSATGQEPTIYTRKPKTSHMFSAEAIALISSVDTVSSQASTSSRAAKRRSSTKRLATPKSSDVIETGSARATRASVRKSREAEEAEEASRKRLTRAGKRLSMTKSSSK